MQAAPWYDWLVFNKVKQRLGGRVKLVVSGAAPLAPHVSTLTLAGGSRACVHAHGP